jgi:hypothetical protein
MTNMMDASLHFLMFTVLDLDLIVLHQTSCGTDKGVL